MTGVAFPFNAATVPFAEPGYPVWDGPVPVQILRTEVKPTAAGNGSNMLIITVGALAGEYRGQENVIRLNLWNANAQAVDIAQRQLSSISHVINRMSWQHTDELIGGQFLSVWAKETREVIDQQTNAKRNIESCQCKDFRLIDGRMSGQPASSPYNPNAPAAAPQTAVQQPQPQTAPGPQMQQQFGGQQPAPNGAFQPPHGGSQAGFQPPPQGGAPQGGFAPSTAGPAPHGFAPGHPGAPQPQMAPGTPTAGFAGNAPQQGFAPPAAPQQQQQYAPPGAPQPGPGPWGPQR